MSKVLSAILGIITVFALFGCSNTPETKTITVGLECEYPPFNWVETSKSARNVEVVGLEGTFADGYDVAIAKMIASSLGLELKIKKIAFDGLIAALQNGEIDLIIAGMSPTSDRKLEIDFTNAYYSSTHVLVLKKTNQYANATSLSDLEGAIGVGQIGTIYNTLVDKMVSEFGCTRIVARDSVPLCILNVMEDEADFTIVEKPVALGLINSNPELTMLFAEENNIFDVAREDLDVSIGIKKGQEELLEQINQVLETISIATREEIMQWAVSNSPINN